MGWENTAPHCCAAGLDCQARVMSLPKAQALTPLAELPALPAEKLLQASGFPQPNVDVIRRRGLNRLNRNGFLLFLSV
jgi:hypothetical protein